MLAMVEFPYEADTVIKALSRERYEALRNAVPQMDMSAWDESKEEAPYWFGSRTKRLIDLSTDGIVLTEYGIGFTIKNFKNTYRPSPAATATGPSNLHVHIPNIGLLMIDEVKVMDDSCTDALQRELDDGWRIVAVCPPNGARRPDYVLGRTKRESAE